MKRLAKLTVCAGRALDKLRWSQLRVLNHFWRTVRRQDVRKQVEAALREADTRRQLEIVEHDLSLARSILQSLLPSVEPQIDGFEIAGWNRPADKTGGDYYDWQVLPNGTVVSQLADVTGHGIGPALLAAFAEPMRELIATLYEAVLTFSAGTKQQDDLTAMVIKRT